MFKPKKANQPKSTNRLKTILEFSDQWEMEQQERYVFQYYHNKLKGLDPNQINIHGVDLHKTDNGFIITAVIRHSLEKKLNLQDVRLVVRDLTGKELGKKDFNMELFGELNSLRARPWFFEFDSEALLVSEEEIQDKMDFEVLFEIQEPAISDFEVQLDENWSTSLNDEQRSSLKSTVAAMDSMKQDEISVSSISLDETENGVNVIIIVRNSFDNDVTISNLPLQLFDASGELVAQLGFPLEKFSFNPKSARPVSLHFSKSVFKKANPDWSSWKVALTAQQ